MTGDPNGGVFDMALRLLDVRTFPTRTYFFLADFASPHDAAWVASELARRDILVRPLGDASEQNQRVLEALRENFTDGPHRAL